MTKSQLILEQMGSLFFSLLFRLFAFCWLSLKWQFVFVVSSLDAIAVSITSFSGAKTKKKTLNWCYNFTQTTLFKKKRSSLLYTWRLGLSDVSGYTQNKTERKKNEYGKNFFFVSFCFFFVLPKRWCSHSWGFLCCFFRLNFGVLAIVKKSKFISPSLLILLAFFVSSLPTDKKKRSSIASKALYQNK